MTLIFLLVPFFLAQSVHSMYLERLVQSKKIEVERLLRQHQSPDDNLVMRMSYLASESKFNLTKSLKLTGDKDDLHMMSVLVDMKRRSPTIPSQRNVVEFTSAAKFAELLALANVDAFLVNTDEMEYGGRASDLGDTSRVMRSLKGRKHPPAVIHKDIIIHPIQIAQALEEGASGVLLIASIVGGDLEVLLDACTIMGTEAMVEVHTPNEVEFALNKGATIFLVNMWDRVSNKLFEEQAKGVASMLPVNSLAIAAGNIHSMEQVAELGFYGYDGVVLGRGINQLPDIKEFVDDVHSFRGAPRGMGLGMKGMLF